MQITINTADILGDEETIRDEVINQISEALTTSMRKQANNALTRMLDENLNAVVKEKVSEVIDMHMETVFEDVDEYGRKGKNDSLRNRIAGIIQSQCVFRKANYRSEENAFTQAIQSVVEKEVAKFKSEFNSLVTKSVIEQSMEMAVSKLKESLGIALPKK